MKIKIPKPVLLLAVATAIIFVGCGTPNLYAVSVNDPADHITSQTVKGKVTVLDFWATWCGPCRQVMPTVQQLYDDYSRKGVLVCGITTDDPQTVNAFLKDNPYTYPMFSDPSRITSTSFNVTELPHLVVLDRGGRIVYSDDGAPLDVKALTQAIDQAMGE